jgi:hypothetical protein
MSDFSTSQSGITQARAARDMAAMDLLRARARKQTAEDALKVFLRGFNGRDENAPAERARLEHAVAGATADLDAHRGNVRQATESLGAARKNFAAFTDPRANVEKLSDGSPFVLFPVRVETRFHSGHVRERVGHQLWVRIYPDDCSIDTFEPTMSNSELANTKLFWQNIWSAGGTTDQERGAWRSLVAAHGSGRAGWLVDTYEPVNVASKPTKAVATDEILVIATQTPLSPVESAAITAYWQAIWLADGNAGKQKTAQDALTAAVGAARASELVASYAPLNLADSPTLPKKKSDVALSTAFLVFPADPVTQQGSWSQAPQVRQFPDRFIVLGFNAGKQTLEAIGNTVTLPLHVGPDPSADLKVDPSSGIHPDGPDLFVPDELQWMVDFDRAVAAGMALSIDLTPEQAAAGFDRVFVIGLQLSASANDGKAALEELLHHHEVSRSGFSILSQGTPTHNTTSAGTGYTKADDPDQSFDDRKNFPLFTIVTDPALKRDGQWLAELLGIDAQMLTGVHGSGGTDQLEARAMQTALWPATLGYWMDKMLTPVFSDEVVADTRSFFTQFVSGRGPVPAIRIGGQPYGILPTTAYSQIRWLDERAIGERLNAPSSFLRGLYTLLRAVDGDWTAMSANAGFVGKAGDAHQTLLDILALQPSSVEYYSRFAESIQELFNVENFWGLGPDFIKALTALGLDGAAAGLLEKLGYRGAVKPDILNHFFLKDAGKITNIIDDRPLSESVAVRAYTDDGRNYIRWLIDAAQTSLDAVEAEQGFTAGKTPESLLYLFLRHALMLGYYDFAYSLYKSANFMSAPELLAMKPEPAFIHVADGAVASESRFAPLYKVESRVTGSPTLRVSDYITSNLALLFRSGELAAQINAVELLETAKTARLERLFAEHIDTCSYRFDAWLQGLVQFQLQRMRSAQGSDNNQATGGAYLGAYAWLEDLRPSSSVLVPAQIAEDIAAQFPGTSPLMSDAANGGYVHAPSLPHSNTAAVLRSGYLANANSANQSTLAINLSSDRVRLALSLLEGIRNGQSLGALLGYRFERGLHDDHGLAEVDKFIYPLRKAFPLVADALTTTQTKPDVPIEAIEARNVLDGRKLVSRVQSSGVATYPYGLTTLPGVSSAAEQAALDSQTQTLLDVYDAIADLALAESVHQAVQGNYERVVGTLDAYSSGNFPPEPEVIQAPPNGIALTHRVGIHFKPGLSALAAATPRAQVEPAIDNWLESMLPALNDIGCTVVWTDPLTSTPHQNFITLADLKLRPFDVLFLIRPDEMQAMSELDDRFLRHVVATFGPRPDAVIAIQYMTAPANKLSVFAATPMVRSLKTLISRSRPLRATDATRHNDASVDDNVQVFADPQRIKVPYLALQTLETDLGNFIGVIQPLIEKPVEKRADIIANIDAWTDQTIALLERAARFNVPSSGWGFLYAWRHNAFADLFAQIGALLTRWKRKLDDYTTAITAYDGLPVATSNADRFKALQAAEGLISVVLDPLPGTPANLRLALDGKHANFLTERDKFVAVLNGNNASFANTLQAAQAISTTAFDSEAFDVTGFGDRAITLAQDILNNCKGHQQAIHTSVTAIATQMNLYAAAGTASAQVQALDSAAKAMLGEDFYLVPEFSLSTAQGQEWANAYGVSTGGQLLSYLQSTLSRDFPVDEWMYGVARVRPMMRAWESLVMLTDVFQVTVPALTPVQFPYEADAVWLAMEFPADHLPDSDRLLYTAYYSDAFSATARQCGLLLDEWTEVIPATDRNTGITFNYNRPDNEPPQCILLVTPAAATGSWQWSDLVGALNETLDLAKKRAVEPLFVDNTPYAPLLPATIMAATLYGISITTSLSVANGALRVLEEQPHA